MLILVLITAFSGLTVPNNPILFSTSLQHQKILKMESLTAKGTICKVLRVSGRQVGVFHPCWPEDGRVRMDVGVYLCGFHSHFVLRKAFCYDIGTLVP